MIKMTIDQFLALGKKCSHCGKNARWLAHKDSPAYCDEHFPYKEEKHMTEPREHKKPDKYYFKGTIYPNQEEFFKAMEYFYNSQLNSESLHMIIRDFVANLEGNLIQMKLLEERVTNQKFNDLLNGAFYYILAHMPSEDPEI